MGDFLYRCARFTGLLVGVDTLAVLVGSTWAGLTCGTDAYECADTVVLPVAFAGVATLVVTLRALAHEIDRSARSRPPRHLMRPPTSSPSDSAET